MKKGMVEMTFQEYLDHPAYGSSDLSAFRAGPPAIVPWGRANRGEDTKATKVGTAAHAAILTPDLFMAQYAIKPEGMTFASKDGKAWRDERLAAGVLEENILTWTEHLQVMGIVEAFYGKEPAKKSLERARAGKGGIELCMFWDDEFGLPRKGRPDWFADGFVYDLKISVDAAKGVGTLAYKAYVNGWMSQLASNRAGLLAQGIDVHGGRLVVIAPKPPHAERTWLLQAAPDALDLLALELDNVSRDMIVCHRSGIWPGTPDDWKEINLPSDHLLADLEAEGAEEADDGA